MRVSMSHHPEGSVERFDRALAAAIENDHSAEFERLRTATYTGRDRDNLVTAVVDGDGIVAKIVFGITAAGRGPGHVEDAVAAAIAAAQAEMSRGWQEFTARMQGDNAELADALAEFQRTELDGIEERARQVWSRVRV
jgi:hypothetical protein